MYFKTTYDGEFDDLYMHLKAKYSQKLFDLDGIGKQLDMSDFSKNFFSAKVTSDASIDANANVDDTSVIAYTTELPKPFFKLNSYYILWKELKRLYGLEIANNIVEMNLTGDIYINDFHGIGAGMPYSYYEKTVIAVKINEELIYTTMKELYDILKEKNKENILNENAKQIDLSNVQVLDENNKFINVSRIIKHKSHTGLVKLETKNGKCTIVTKDHPVIMDSGEKYAQDLCLNDNLKISNSNLPFKNTTFVDLNYAYFVGFLIGDGWINKDKNLIKDGTPRHLTFSIRQKNIEKTKIYNVVNKLFNNVKLIKKDLINFGYKTDVTKLLEIGIGSNNKKLPKDILNWNISSIKSLICGIIDSDGSVEKNGNISIRMSSFELIQQLSEILISLNSGRVRSSFCGKYQSEKSFESNFELYRCSIRLNDLEFEKYSEKIINNRNIVYKEIQKDGRFETNLLNKIEDMEETEYVYDITTDSGQFHCQGLIQHNCFNYSTYDIHTKGLPMVKKVKSLPPKHLYAFKSQLEQFTVIASNSTLGATGLADMLVVMSYYVNNILNTKSDAHFKFPTEKDCWNYVKENLISFIYTINQPMRANQSPFTNISIYDDYFLDGMCDDYIFMDGSSPDKKIIKKLQEIYLDIMNEELKRTPLTFPVTTACFSIDKDKNIQDMEFLKFISKQNQEYGFINIYCGDSSTLSSCCFDGKQKCLTKGSGKINLLSFEDLYKSKYEDTKKNFTILHNGSWVQGKIIRLPKRNMYKITTSNKKELYVTDNHIFPTIEGDKKVSEITINDFLMFNTRKLDTFPEKDKKLTYEQGYLIGMYLGDGSCYLKNDGNNNTPSVHLSLNEYKYKKSKEIIDKALAQLDKDAIYTLDTPYNNVYPTRISNWLIYNFIKDYVKGNYCYEKELDLNFLAQSVEFRKGILEGYYLTDGGNSNRIYTTSKNLVEQMECLITSLGINSVIDISDRTDEKVIIRKQSYNRNYPLYCIRWYDMCNKRSMKNVYKVKNNSEYFSISSIEPYEYDNDFVYCFEIKNQEEPYFTLPNGVISHNCRLRSDKKNEYFNSFGSGSSKIGSLGVCTINFPRLAIKYPNQDKFLEQLKYMTEICSKVNNAKRKIVEKRIKNGNEPLYTLEFMDLSKQYSTCGVCGFNECITLLEEDILKESGQKLGIKILDTINSVNEKMQKQYNAPHNCEQIPAENTAVKLASKDKLLNYQHEYNLYSNQFIPLTTNADILDRIYLQGIFDGHFSGGAICHLNVDQKIEDHTKIMDLIRNTAKQGVVYFAINYVLSECEEGHMSVTNGNICTICGKPIINHYTRVVGFLTLIKNWNKTRREEDFPNRQFYHEV